MESARREMVHRRGLTLVLVIAALVAAGCSSSKNDVKVTYTASNAESTKLGNENIARFQRLVDEGLNQGKLSVMDELLSPTVVDHQFYGPGYPPSRGGVKGLTAALRTAFHACTEVWPCGAPMVLGAQKKIAGRSRQRKKRGWFMYLSRSCCNCWVIFMPASLISAVSK